MTDTTKLAERIEALEGALGAIQQRVEDAAYCVKADTPKSPFIDALNDIHAIAQEAHNG